MDDNGPISGTVLLLLLIMINAVIAGMKSALDHVSESSVRKKAEAGEHRAAALLKLLERPDRYFHAFELLLSFMGILTGLVYASHFMNWIEPGGSNSKSWLDIAYIKPVYSVLSISIIVFLTTLLGTVLPYRFSAKHAEGTAYRTLELIKLLGFLLRPVTWILKLTMDGLLHLFGVKPAEFEDNVTEEELISMVNEGQEQGVFDAGEAEMISNIIELDEKEAQDIMTHKKKIVAVSSDMTVEEALHFMLSESYSRYPLYEGNRDNIIGILHLKDVIVAYISEELRRKPLSEIAREPYFVPDTQNINILFHEMQATNIHMAIVIDEYGQTAGLVAMEDFLEEIVGNIQDEYDEDEKLILSVGPDNCIVKGSISLEELEDELQIIISHEDFDTLNGLLISLLARIPADGEKATLEFAGYQFDILETRNKMIEQVRINKLPEKNTEDQTQAEK
jgi:putative hemolysin